MQKQIGETQDKVGFQDYSIPFDPKIFQYTYSEEDTDLCIQLFHFSLAISSTFFKTFLAAFLAASLAASFTTPESNPTSQVPSFRWCKQRIPDLAALATG